MTTRFGMSEFRFDSATSGPTSTARSITCAARTSRCTGSSRTRSAATCLGRKPGCASCWCEIPKKMHWNYFRFCIGPVPDRWFDICDEAGLLDPERVLCLDRRSGLVQGLLARTTMPEEMIRQYKDWMRDNWNHPSVAVWDANNETKNDIFGAQDHPRRARARPLQPALGEQLQPAGRPE